MKEYSYRKERLGKKVCNVKDCDNTFESPIWYVCKEHRDLDRIDDYEYKIDNPEKYYRDLMK